MKTTAFLLFIGLASYSHSYGQVFINHVKFLGNVKSVTTVEYRDAYDDSITRKKSDSTITTFKNGLPLTDSTFDFDLQTGAFNELFVNQCDKHGNVVKRSRFDAKNHLAETISYRYNDGKLKKEKAYYVDGSLDYIARYKYDNNNNLIEETDQWADPTLNDKTIYKYDSNGNKIEYDRYVPHGGLQDRQTYEYNEHGQETKEDGYGPVSFFKYEMIFKYDQSGNLIEQDVFKKPGVLLSTNTFRYKFDDSKNWLEKLEIDHLVPVVVNTTNNYSSSTYKRTIRIITYY